MRLFRDELNRLDKIKLKLQTLNSNLTFSVKNIASVAPHPRLGDSPVHIAGITLGGADRTLPTLGLFGGIHGLERIGSQVVLSFWERLLDRLAWDQSLRTDLEHFRIVSIPIVNPGGVLLGRRSNPAGVDLMRNSPVEAETRTPWLAGGHRVGPWLPWYRGPKDAPMEPESRALIEFVREQIFPARTSFALDCHSGFGFKDRLWYPFSKSVGDFPRTREALQWSQLFDQSHPEHVYQIEPMSDAYAIHGDLWDHLFLEHARSEHAKNVFLPWTLEMGSWQWVRKNPLQLFSKQGLFNPIKPHRYRRTLRRHQVLLEFLMRSIRNDTHWVSPVR